jgi:hypothetical protein
MRDDRVAPFAPAVLVRAISMRHSTRASRALAALGIGVIGPLFDARDGRP